MKQVELSLQDSSARNEYQKPKVITFGSVAKLTLGGTGTALDGCSGKTGKSNGNCS